MKIHKKVRAQIDANQREYYLKEQLKAIREELGAALYQKLDLNLLSEKLHISKSNIIRIFKKRYGVTPYEYLIASKIEAAKALLVNTQLPIKEIADRLCIVDEHYFSTLFCNRVGVRPSHFRKNVKNVIKTRFDDWEFCRKSKKLLRTTWNRQKKMLYYTMVYCLYIV